MVHLLHRLYDVDAPTHQHSCTHRLHDARVRCSSPFHWSWVGNGLAPDVMGGRPHLFHNLPLPLPPAFTPVPNYTVWWQKRHMGVNNLPRVVVRSSRARPGIELVTSDRQSDALPLHHRAKTGPLRPGIRHTGCEPLTDRRVDRRDRWFPASVDSRSCAWSRDLPRSSCSPLESTASCSGQRTIY